VTLTRNNGSFGISVLDEGLGGPMPGGMHALIGGPGTGKTVAALQFMMEGIREGGRVAMLIQARPEDVIDLARAMGMNPDAHLRSGSWVMLGYQSGFRDRYRRMIEPEDAFGELRTFLEEGEAPNRLVIDTCGPLVESRESGQAAELLIELLSELQSTSLLTFAAESPGDLDDGFDFISQRAALILHLAMRETGRREMVVRKTLGPLESTGPITFDIREGHGIVPPVAVERKRRSDLTPEVLRRVLLLDIPGDMPEELRLWLSEAFDLVYTKDPVEAFPELAQREFGVVAVHIDRRTVSRGLHVMHQMRRAARRPPILLFSPVDVRASDRAQALRAGADDFVSGGIHPDELASRIAALLRRGRPEMDDEEVEKNGAAKPVVPEKAEVRDIVREQLKTPGAGIFSMVVFRPKGGRGLHALANHVADQMRQETGDRVSVFDHQVHVYLHGALASQAQRFLQRVKKEPFTDVATDVYTAPIDRQRLIEVIEQ
jgi:KaiC/GvpD/RAD55 family RecA-like ATPase